MGETLALLGGKPLLRKSLREPHYIEKDEKAAVLEVLKTGRLSHFVAKYNEEFFGGPYVKKLEKRFADYFGSGCAVSMNSATSALFASVYALGICPGDEVIVTPYTMSATSTSILSVSGIPVFVDVDPDDFNMDVSKIEGLITDKTKAIMVVHLFGNPVDMDKVVDIAKRHKLKVIEDCAQAPGAKYKNKYVGTFGDVGIFSLNRHKTIQAGEGGVIITNDSRLCFKLQLIRNHAEAVIDQMEDKKGLNLIGWNYRMTELEAAVGTAQIMKLDKLNALRIKNGGYLSGKLKAFDWIIPNKPKEKTRCVYYRYPFRFLGRKLGIKRSTFAKAMKEEGFFLNEGYLKPLYLQSVYKKRKETVPYLGPVYSSSRNYEEGICPVAEKLYKEEFMFSPIAHLARDERDVDLFVKALKKIEENIQVLKKYET